MFFLRNRHTSDGKYIAKLSLRELRLFSDQVNALPCIIKEAQLIKELLQKVLDFQKEVQQALDDKVPDSSKLERLISAGIALDVDLEEIPKLKQANTKLLDRYSTLIKRITGES